MHSPLCSWPLALSRPWGTLDKMAEQSECSGLPPHWEPSPCPFLLYARPGLVVGYQLGEDLGATWVSRPTGMEHEGQGKRGRGGVLTWASFQDEPCRGVEGGNLLVFQSYQGPQGPIGTTH